MVSSHRVHVYVRFIVKYYYFVGTQIVPGTQTIRIGTPGTTIFKTIGTGSIEGGTKQIITVHKAGGSASGQPQIVTLVKTPQGMTVATVNFKILTLFWI